MIGILISALRKYGSASVQKAGKGKMFYEPQMKKCCKSTTSVELSRKHAVAGQYRKTAQGHSCAVHPKGWSCLLLRTKA